MYLKDNGSHTLRGIIDTLVALVIVFIILELIGLSGIEYTLVESRLTKNLQTKPLIIKSDTICYVLLYLILILITIKFVIVKVNIHKTMLVIFLLSPLSLLFINIIF